MFIGIFSWKMNTTRQYASVLLQTASSFLFSRFCGYADFHVYTSYYRRVGGLFSFCHDLHFAVALIFAIFLTNNSEVSFPSYIYLDAKQNLSQRLASNAVTPPNVL